MTFRTPWLARTAGFGVVLNSLILGRHHWGWLLGVPLGLVGMWTYHRLRTVVDDDGVTARTVRATRRLAWADVVAVRKKGAGVVAVTRDGEQVVLPWVEWRTPLRNDSAYVYPRSGQAVVQRARAAGYDVALEEVAGTSTN